MEAAWTPQERITMTAIALDGAITSWHPVASALQERNSQEIAVNKKHEEVHWQANPGNTI